LCPNHPWLLNRYRRRPLEVVGRSDEAFGVVLETAESVIAVVTEQAPDGSGLVAMVDVRLIPRERKLTDSADASLRSQQDIYHIVRNPIATLPVVLLDLVPVVLEILPSLGAPTLFAPSLPPERSSAVPMELI
jgi:hypothetical protein